MGITATPMDQLVIKEGLSKACEESAEKIQQTASEIAALTTSVKLGKDGIERKMIEKRLLKNAKKKGLIK